MVQMVFQHLPTFSSVLQHLPASLSMRVKDIDALWRSGISVHVGVVLFFEADHFLPVCAFLVIVCFFSVCRFYQRGTVKCWSDVCRQPLLQLLLGPLVVWLVCKREIHDVIVVLDPNIWLSPKRFRKLEPDLFSHMKRNGNVHWRDPDVTHRHRSAG